MSGVSLLLAPEPSRPSRQPGWVKAIPNFNERLVLVSEAFPAPASFAGDENKCFSPLRVAALCGVGHLPTWRGFFPIHVSPQNVVLNDQEEKKKRDISHT